MAAFVLAAAFVVFVDDEEAEFAEADTSIAKDSGAPAFDAATLAEADVEAPCLRQPRRRLLRKRSQS